jgi:YesN/AraC family two-component response regulator
VLSEKIKAYEDYTLALMNIGNCYNFMNLTDSCEYYYMQSYRVARNKKIHTSETYLGKNLASFYYEKGNYQLAKTYIQEALATSYSIGDNEMILGCLTIFSLIEKAFNNFEGAEKYGLQALTLADSINAREQQKNALYNLYLISDKKKEPEKALDYYIRYRELKDSIYNNETQSKILELSAKYESEKKELQINQQQDEIQKSRLRLHFFMVLILVLVAFIGSAILVLIKRNRMLRDLLSKNIEAMEAEKKLREALDVPPCSNAPLIINDEKYKRSTLSVPSRNLLEEQFDKLIVEQQLWKQGDITLAKVANLLDTNTKYLSQITNQKYGQSFPNYINELRVKAARCMLVGKEYSNHTIEAIGIEVGFNSNSSFVSAFKKYSGLTPSYFRDSQKPLKHDFS